MIPRQPAEITYKQAIQAYTICTEMKAEHSAKIWLAYIQCINKENTDKKGATK